MKTLAAIALATSTMFAGNVYADCADNVYYWLYNQGLCGASNCYDENNTPLRQVIKRECKRPDRSRVDHKLLAEIKAECNGFDGYTGTPNMPNYLMSYVRELSPSSNMHPLIAKACMK